MFEIVILSLVLLTECMAGFPHSWQCAEGFGKNVSIQTTDIPGSYNVIYCAPVSEIETKWDLRVDTLPNFSANNCIFSSRTEHQGTKRHSWVSIPIQNGNCSRVSDTVFFVIPIICICLVCSLSICLNVSSRSALQLECTSCTKVATAWRICWERENPTMLITLLIMLKLLALNIFVMDHFPFMNCRLSK